MWHRDWLDGGVLAQQLDYWRDALRSMPSRLELPTDRPRPAVRAYVGDHTSRMLSMDVRRASRRSHAKARPRCSWSYWQATPRSCSRYSGQDDVVIGTPFAGRHRSELESMIGYFINPLALRVDVSDDPTFRELLDRARERDARRVRARRRAVRDGRACDLAGTRPQPDAGLPGDDGAPQPRVGAQAAEVRAGRSHRHRARAREGVGEVRPPARNEPAPGRAQHDLGVQHRALRGRHRRPHRRTLREAARVDRRRSRSAGVAAADAPRRRAVRADLRLVEGAQGLSAGQARQGPVRGGRARKSPTPTPSSSKATRLTYRQLDERANRLAHRLQRLGVGPRPARRDLHGQVARPRRRSSRL